MSELTLLLNDYDYLVVPNQRLASDICGHLAQQKKAFLAKPVLTFKAWVSDLYRPYEDLKSSLLDDLQALIWIRHHFLRSVNLTLDPESFFQAYQRLKRWNHGEKELLAYPKNPSQERFVEAYRAIESLKKRENILFFEDLIKKVIHILQTESLSLPRVYIYGFDDYYPLQEELLRAYGVHLFLEKKESDRFFDFAAKKYIFLSEDDEIKQAALWLKEQDPKERSAIIVPDLQKDFEYLKRCILEAVEPHLLELSLPQQSQTISFSHGTPLEQEPLVLMFLNFLQDQNSHTLQHELCQELIIWVEDFLDRAHRANLFQEFTLSSHEYQAIEKLKGSLLALSDLSFFLGDLSFEQAYDTVVFFLSKTIFQPQSLGRQKMVLGLLEAAALNWDRVWMIRADSDRFPQSLEPASLLPQTLQEYYGYPHGSFEREQEYLQKVLNRFKKQSCEMTISLTQSLHSHKRPSCIVDSLFSGPYETQLLDNLVDSALPIPYLSPSYQRAKKQTLSLSVLEAYVQCPFWGFAKSLDQSEIEDKKHPWLSPRSYGQLVHQILQNLIQKDSTPLQNKLIWPQPLLQAHEVYWSAALAQFFQSYPMLDLHFKVEHTVFWQINQHLTIKGRIDLYDPIGGRVIDIKTSDQSLNLWMQEKPLSWQGPVYALATEAEFLGVLTLSAQKLVYKEDSTENYLGSWQRGAQAVAEKWNQGNYEPQPRDASVCRHCPYQSSCRIYLVHLT